MLRSLQGKLAAALIAGFVVLAFAAAAASLHALRREAERMSDSALQETAQRLLPLVITDIVGRDADDDEERGSDRIAAVRPHDELLTYVVRDDKGKLLLQSHDANLAVFPPGLKPGFTATPSHRIYTEPGLQGTLSLMIAEPLAARRRAQIEAVWAIVKVFALFLPLGLAGIWLIVRTGLRPIRRFCDGIAARGQSDLSPLARQPLATEMAPIADAVNGLMARLDRALAAERGFNAHSAHELRTPIAAALAQTQRLMADADDLSSAELRERVQPIERALRTLARRGESLMQLSKAENGRVLADAPQDLRAVLELVVEDFRRAAHTAHAARAIQLDLPEQPVESWIDPDAFAIIARNLLDNALKHGTPLEPVQIALSASGQFSVTNHAPVLRDDELARLVKPFERGTTPADGSGLGLAIVEAIVRGAGAVLTLRSPAPGWPDGLQVSIEGLPLAP
ncbi:MAG: HAMP domain-containing histidine kinase [Burkholderiaceae bacterium]|jgi:two-component system OmpR family sensor kinase|nr:HAMP domain-containing histidine kinase [Burkholderiaceae bacterium]